MRLTFAALLLASSAAVVAPAALAAPGAAEPAGAERALSGSAAEAAAVVDAFHAALQRGDTEGAALLLSDDVVVFEGGGVERSKAEYADHHLPADAIFAASVSSRVSRRTGGGSGDLAWVASEGRTKGTYDGKPLDRATSETMVLRRSGSSWKIVHIHWSSGKAKGD